MRSPAETPDSASRGARTPKSPVAESADQDLPVNSDTPPKVSLHPRMLIVKLLSMDDAETIAGHWRNKVTLQNIGKLASKKGGRALAAKLADLVESGTLGAANAVYFERFSPRVLFPSISRHWVKESGTITDWDKPGAVGKILDRIGTWRQMATELGPTPSAKQCADWIAAQEKTEQKATTDGPDLSAFAKPEEKHYRIEPAPGAESKRIAVYGQTIWPADNGAYSFEEAWAAFHFWQDEDRYLATAQSDPAKRGWHFRPMNAWLEYVSHGFAKAWWKIANAQCDHPELASKTEAPGKLHRGE